MLLHLFDAVRVREAGQRAHLRASFADGKVMLALVPGNANNPFLPAVMTRFGDRIIASGVRCAARCES